MGNMNDGGKRITFGEGTATREPDEGKGRYDLITPFGLRRLALWYELGAKKYADRNWEKGMPFSRYLNSAKRHLDKYLMGMTDEDHLAAAAWNILAIIHHEELGQTEFDDLPHYITDERKPADTLPMYSGDETAISSSAYPKREVFFTINNFLEGESKDEN